MKLWEAPKKLFTAQVPKDLEKYIGSTILIPEFATVDGKRLKISEERVRIQTICGNKFKQQFYEINGTHLIGMLRFHAQMEKAKDITEDEMCAFEEMELSAKKLPTEVSNG